MFAPCGYSMNALDGEACAAYCEWLELEREGGKVKSHGGRRSEGGAAVGGHERTAEPGV